MTTIIRRTSSDLASMSRAAQRKERLLQIEREQRIEEAEALKMTEEQREILLRSFTSVKVEFSDLDGLKWTHSALRRRQDASHSKSPGSPTPPNHAFVILTNADLASFSPEDTIRASAARPRPRFPSHSSPNLSRGSRAGSPANSRSPVKSPFPGSSPKLPVRHKESRRASDVEFVPSFHAAGYDSDCDKTVRGGSDVESDVEYESSGGGIGRWRGRGKRVGRSKRKIRKSMAGDDGMMNNEDEDDGAWEDIKGGAEDTQTGTIEVPVPTQSSTFASRVSSSTIQLGNRPLLRDILPPLVTTTALTTSSKAPAFITYSSPDSRIITSSSSAPSLSSSTASSTQPVPRPTVPTSPQPLSGVSLLQVSHPLTDIVQSSVAPLPLTRLPHRVRHIPSSLALPASQLSSPPLASLPFPFTSPTFASTPETTPQKPETLPPLQKSFECAKMPAEATWPASAPSSSFLWPPRPEQSAPGTLTVRSWNPSLSERQDVHAEGTPAYQDSLASAMNISITSDKTNAQVSSLGC